MSASAGLRRRLISDPRRRLQRHLRDLLHGGLDELLRRQRGRAGSGRDPSAGESPAVLGKPNGDVCISRHAAHAHGVCRVSRVLRARRRLSVQRLRGQKLPDRGQHVLMGGVRRVRDGGVPVAAQTRTQCELHGDAARRPEGGADLRRMRDFHDARRRD